MTIDDENSVYVGGIPYDATEESLSRVFDLFGKIVAVKIVNDRDIGGKCYAFVTYTNPRSAIDAINEMDGASIDGRIVRVNEVKTRGAKPNFNRDNFRRGMGRGMNLQRDRVRDRDQHHGRAKHWDRERDTDHDRDGFRSRPRDYRHDRDRGHFNQEQTRGHFSDQDRDGFRSMDDYENNYHPSHEETRDQIMNENQDVELDGTSTHGNEDDKHNDQPLKKRNRSNYSDNHSEQISESGADHHDQDVPEQLERSIQKRAELQSEISLMEEKLKARQQEIHDMHRKSQKLESSLTAKKKLVNHRQMQLTKLHKCFMQVKECNEKLKSSENELQTLVDSVMTEVGNDKDASRDADGLISLSA